MVFGRKKDVSAPPPPPPPAASATQTSRQLSRQSDRTVQRAQRDMQRERLRLEQEERQITAEMKRLGRAGRMAEARMLAKNLVQVRTAKARTFQAGVQVAAIGSQARMAQTEAKMVDIVGRTTGVMRNANGLMDPNAQMKTMQAFGMESEKYKLNQEMTDEVLDSVLGGEELDDDTDDVLNSVLDEIGLEVGSRVGSTPQIQPVAVPQQQQLQAADDAVLRERIARLGGDM